MINKMCKDVEAEFDVQITNGEKQYIYLHIATNTALHIGTINQNPFRETNQRFIRYYLSGV